MTSLDDAIEELRKNAKQWEAFAAIGNCVTVAPPGSGKTKLLTVRLAYEAARVIDPPQGVACITLTHSAADEIENRLAILGVRRRRNIFIGTLHAFARNQIIRPFAAAARRNDLGTLKISSTVQVNALKRAAITEHYGDLGKRYKQVSDYFDKVRQRYPLESDQGWSRVDSRLRNSVVSYRNSLRHEELTDFCGLIESAVELVETYPPVRQMIGMIFPSLYVDEYQDLAPGLDRLVRAICLDSTSKSALFAVGDPDQAVFGFSGALPDLLYNLVRQPEIRKVELEVNYRSRHEIIRRANMMRRGRVPMIGLRAGGSVLAIHCPEGLAQQYRYVLESIVAARAAGTSLHNIAVVCPFNLQCDEISKYLQDAGLAVAARSRYFRLTAATSLVQDLADWAVGGQVQSDNGLGNLLARWKILLGSHWDRSSTVRLTEYLLQCTPDISAVQFFDDVREIGLARILLSNERDENVVELDRMRDALAGPMKESRVVELAERASAKDRVEITNLTLSKGLEFDLVLVISMEEDICPYYLSKSSPEDMAEDRRKFYVALTRARNEVRFIYSGWITKPWGEQEYTGPSRFLREIGLV